MTQHNIDSWADMLGVQKYPELDSEAFAAKLQEIFDIHEATDKERNTHKFMLNDLTVLQAYNLMYEVIEQVEKFKLNDDPDIVSSKTSNDIFEDVVFIEPSRHGKPEVKTKRYKRKKTMTEIINQFHCALSHSSLAHMSVHMYYEDENEIKTNIDTIVRIIDCTIDNFYDIFKFISDIKNNYNMNTRLGDTNSTFEWNGL